MLHTCLGDMGGIWLLAGMWLLGADPSYPAPAPVEPANIQPASIIRESMPEARFQPLRIDARNEMGRRFRLVEVVYMVNRLQVLKVTAGPNEEVDLSLRAPSVPLAGGEHTLTVVMTFQGRGVGLFTYLDNYRFRTVASYAFYLERSDQPPVIKVLARERPGFFVSMEKKPMLEISAPFGQGVTPMTGVNHGTEVSVSK
jgi:hypothetical protein